MTCCAMLAVAGIGAALLGLSGSAAAAGCLEGAKDRNALIQCSKSELVTLEKRAAAAQNVLLDRHAGDTATLGRLREAKRTSDSARTAQCALESRLKSAASPDESAALEAERAMMVCIRREFARQVEDLDALVAATKKAP